MFVEALVLASLSEVFVEALVLATVSAAFFFPTRGFLFVRVLSGWEEHVSFKPVLALHVPHSSEIVSRDPISITFIQKPLTPFAVCVQRS